MSRVWRFMKCMAVWNTHGIYIYLKYVAPTWNMWRSFGIYSLYLEYIWGAGHAAADEAMDCLEKLGGAIMAKPPHTLAADSQESTTGKPPLSFARPRSLSLSLSLYLSLSLSLSPSLLSDKACQPHADPQVRNKVQLPFTLHHHPHILNKPSPPTPHLSTLNPEL